MKSERGFGAISVLLLLVVVGIIGSIGWYVWNLQENGETYTSVTSASNKEDKTQVKTKDQTNNWPSYTNEAGLYSLKYPESWVIASNLEDCSEGLVLLAPSPSSLGKCASSHGGQVQIFSTAGDVTKNYALNETYYTNKVIEDVIVNGVKGSKITTDVSGMEKEVFNGSYPDKTIVVNYVFVSQARTFVATYIQEPGYPDALSEFNTLVMKTWKFPVK